MNSALPITAITKTGSARPLVITAALVMIVLSMVVPIPASLLDFGIAISIATATLVLVMAALVEKPTDFQAFPVMLLVSLLIRLSLNVSSTRLILTEGQTGKNAAGEVISGFAEFVAGGSLLVGVTIFAVISVVNFMVITKGSGRMAEVAARFALDSLPGKQLAIDGDLNSGAIDHEQAKARRVHEQKEISFFGSLDGASKFVKGDAVAGIVITMINFFIGLAVGVTSHGMPVGEALSTYSHLTIGDGLVSQIPALITSMAAALLLSRGGATETTADLLANQFTSNWRAPALVATGMVVLSVVPGMPTLLFLLLAAIFGFIAARAARPHEAAPEPATSPVQPEPAAAKIGDMLDADEILVEIGPDLVASALDTGTGLSTRVSNLRNHIAKTFGLILPDVRITDSTGLPGGEYIIRIHDVVRARGTLRNFQMLALGDEQVLAALGGQPVREPVYDSPARWISPEQQDNAAIAGATVVSPMEFLTTHLMEVVRTGLPALLTMTSLQKLIAELKNISDTDRAQAYQRYFDGMIPDKVAPELLLQVLRGLLEEKVSIRNLPLIVDAVFESRAAGTPDAVLEQVRKRLRGQITQALLDDGGELSILQLHPGWEAEFTRAEAPDPARAAGALAPNLSRKLADAVRQTLPQATFGKEPVLAVPDHRRRLIRAILGSHNIPIAVIGFDEIDEAAKVRLAATVEAAA